jgi:hypothetical protein
MRKPLDFQGFCSYNLSTVRYSNQLSYVPKALVFQLFVWCWWAFMRFYTSDTVEWISP